MAAAFLTNFFFWTGAALGGVAFAALLEITGGQWAGPLRLGGERCRRFLPVFFVVFLILMWRCAALYPPQVASEIRWFTATFVGLRDASTLAGLSASAFVFF